MIVIFACEENDNSMVAQSACEYNTIESEIALWETFECSDESIKIYKDAFRLFEDYWDGFDLNCPLDINTPFTKVINSAFLLRNGLSDGNMRWHGTIDYRHVGEAVYTNTHYQIHYRQSSSTDWLALAETGRYPNEDRTWLGCLLFGHNESTNNPSTRAGDFIHEGWHHWQYKHGYNTVHMEGPIGACTREGNTCDWYYYHTLKEYAFGEMWKYALDNDDHILFHSPNQVQVEFLCDLAEYPNDFVPMIIKELARAEANQRLSTRFRNAVAYRCGEPRPW